MKGYVGAPLAASDRIHSSKKSGMWILSSCQWLHISTGAMVIIFGGSCGWYVRCTLVDDNGVQLVVVVKNSFTVGSLVSLLCPFSFSFPWLKKECELILFLLPTVIDCFIIDHSRNVRLIDACQALVFCLAPFGFLLFLFQFRRGPGMFWRCGVTVWENW